MRFLDTMSLHIACSGFTHEQRDIIFNNFKDDKDQKTTESEKIFNRSSKPVRVITIIKLQP